MPVGGVTHRRAENRFSTVWACTEHIGSVGTLFLQGRPQNRYGSLNQFPLQCPHTQIPFFFCVSRSIKDFPGLPLLSVSLHLSCSWCAPDAGSHISHSVKQLPITPTALDSFHFIQCMREEGGWNSVVSLSSLGLCFWHTHVSSEDGLNSPQCKGTKIENWDLEKTEGGDQRRSV